MAARYQAVLKVSGLNSSSGGRNSNSIFFYLEDGTSDEDAITAATALAGLTNGLLTSVNKQILPEVAGPYPPATANGGSDLVRVLARNASGMTENITIPFVKHNVTRQAIEAVLEDAGIGFRNRYDTALVPNLLGQVVNLRATQIVDGA